MSDNNDNINFAVLCATGTSSLMVTLVFLNRSLQSKQCSCSNKLWVLSICTMFLCCVRFCLELQYTMSDDKNIFKYEQLIRANILLFVYSLYQNSIIVRFYVTFLHYPEYSLSKNTIIYLTILISIVPLIFAPLYNVFSVGTATYLILWGIEVIITFLFNFCMLCLFLTRLYHMILDLQTSMESFLIDAQINRRDNKHNYNNKSIPVPAKQENNYNDGDYNYNYNYNKCKGEEYETKNHDHGSDIYSSYSIIVETDNKSIRRSSIFSVNTTLGSSTIINTKNRYKIQQKQVVDIMSKITLLTIVEQILFILWIIVYYSPLVFEYLFKFSGQRLTDIVDIGYYVYQILISLNVFFICLVLYFTFEFNDYHYYICCNLCHTWLKNCCFKLLAKRSKKRLRFQSVSQSVSLKS